MRSKMLYVAMLMVAFAVANPGLALSLSQKPARPVTRWPRTTELSDQNLSGKMFTLSYNGGGISFFPSSFSPSASSMPYTPYYLQTSRPYPVTTYPASTYPPSRYPSTTYPPPTYPPSTYPPSRYPSTTYPASTYPPSTYPPSRYPSTTYPPSRYPFTTYPPWTTPPTTTGVSVCLRYLIDYMQTSSPTIFTLSPSSSSSLRLAVSYPGPYILYLNRYGYYDMHMKPDIRFWMNVGPEIWTRVCLTVDSVKRVAQVFSGSNMSIRKRMPIQYVWPGEPVIDFSGFDGQVTDVQVWDYPLNYKEIFNYMTKGIYSYRPYRGSILTWSSISYSNRGNVLLEDVYEERARQPISSRRKGRQPTGEKKTREFVKEVEVKEKKRQQLERNFQRLMY